MATRIIGEVGSYNSKEEMWENYVERLELYFSVNEISDVKKVPTLLTLVEKETYGLLRDLCSPTKPSSVAYDSLVKKVSEHYNPKPNIIAERKRFTSRRQSSNETIAEYVAALRNLSKSCEFGGTLEERLRDQFVEGLECDKILTRLLTKSDFF